MSKEIETVEPSIPLVVQLGFAGSRRLLDTQKHPEVDEAQFLAKVQEALFQVLRSLPEKLKLSPQHFFCGVSQIAAGADMMFTRACARLDAERRLADPKRPGTFQRIFLPQPRDEYFRATARNGERDFTEAEAKEAEALLGSSHIIEDKPVSESAVRGERFEDVNLELVRVSDVLIALKREEGGGAPKKATSPEGTANAEEKQGGTKHFIERAKAREKPLMEITVHVKDGAPDLDVKWDALLLPEDKRPKIPRALAKCRGAEEGNYAGVLRRFAANEARRHQWRFTLAARVIVGAHFVATLFATLVLAFPEMLRPAVPTLLGAELGFLVTGMAYHAWVHFSKATKRWAVIRLVAELARSVTAMEKVPGYLRHLFTPSLPRPLRSLLRTLNVFHLKATRGVNHQRWEHRRTAYVQKRLAAPKVGQIDYYIEKREKARRGLNLANILFYTGGALALLMTASEFVFAKWLEHQGELINHLPGFLAIILPVVSVAVVSLAASFDLEARRHTYEDMVEALEKQRQYIDAAVSEQEFAALVLETEGLLVGENANWFSRRAFTGVA